MRTLRATSTLAAIAVGLTLLPTWSSPTGADWSLSACDIIGTDGPDTLSGTDAPEVICGLDGDDLIYVGAHDGAEGGPGADTIIVVEASPDGTGAWAYGGSGADRLVGGPGQDGIQGGPGDDVILGGPGDDFIEGGEGSDIIRGGTGDDRLYGGEWDFMRRDYSCPGEQNGAPDRLYGGPGDDSLIGAGGPDTLVGGSGDDFLQGLDDADRLVGGPGNDRLRGHCGSDRLFGAQDGTCSAARKGAMCSTEAPAGIGPEAAREPTASRVNPATTGSSPMTATAMRSTAEKGAIRVAGTVASTGCATWSGTDEGARPVLPLTRRATPG